MLKSWRVSHDPKFVVKAVEIVDINLHPRDGALVSVIEEKQRIHALERAQTYLSLTLRCALLQARTR